MNFLKRLERKSELSELNISYLSKVERPLPQPSKPAGKGVREGQFAET